MNYSAKLRLYFHICKRFRGKVLDFWGLIGKNLRRLREVLLVPQISQIHTDSWFGFKATQMTQMVGDEIPKKDLRHLRDKTTKNKSA